MTTIRSSWKRHFSGICARTGLSTIRIPKHVEALKGAWFEEQSDHYFILAEAVSIICFDHTQRKCVICVKRALGHEDKYKLLRAQYQLSVHDHGFLRDAIPRRD
ncbi:hypothetical protein G7K_2098-t1 [Saitoella complicata NRRL Y-17804]|uniref:Uncharacterized protein n=1 Tax=Saitoella complicata (strain BCRC 22490 / CBS 7301 / JCM 7358 / NBRC 10748 / NRRL Y-17804) TaxID=698492 RepID=A0A0E9NDI0_SAICN|nr:hypothetical protein G7K_2098-t1 [Saitoella complicata NRRL Y-17804]